MDLCMGLTCRGDSRWDGGNEEERRNRCVIKGSIVPILVRELQLDTGSAASTPHSMFFYNIHDHSDS